MPRSTSVNSSGHVTRNFETRRILEAIDTGMLRAGARILGAAEAYWRESEWTQERHPEMTGHERDSGIFEINAQVGHHVRLMIGARTPYAVYEEFGTGHRAGHMPVRNTVDTVARRLAPIARQAIKRELRRRNG